MAKGVEDSAYYRWSRFAALNEVGGDPARFGSTVGVRQGQRAERYPESMTTLSTHDTKRSEDVRARLAVLAEIPRSGPRLCAAAGAAPARRPAAGPPCGRTWSGRGRCPVSAHAYAEKAAREAAPSTTWTAPDEEFEGPAARARRRRVRRSGDDRGDRRVGRAPDRPVALVELPSQKLLQLTMPGVPDVYQGTEPGTSPWSTPTTAVRWTTRSAASCSPGWDRGEVLAVVDETGAAKLLVVSRTLRARWDQPELFAGYEPVEVTGPGG